MKLKEIDEVWNSANPLFKHVLVCCYPKILLPWQRDVTISPLYQHSSIIKLNHGVDMRTRTQATTVGGECSHHCTVSPCSSRQLLGPFDLFSAVETKVKVKGTYCNGVA